MNEVSIWHNPRCSKSRETLQLLKDRGIAPTEINYLTDPPSRQDIKSALLALNLEPIAMMRTKDALFRELSLSPDSSENDLIDAMLAHPKLIERPIVFANGKAAIGRPPQAVLDILSD